MSEYDRGEFVKNRTITIEPCANGSFVLMRGALSGERHLMGTMLAETVAFSTDTDMLRFLQSEYTAIGPIPPDADKSGSSQPSYTAL